MTNKMTNRPFVIQETDKCLDFNFEFKSGIELKKFQNATICKMLEREESFKLDFYGNHRIRPRKSNKPHKTKCSIIHTNIGILSNKVGSGKTMIILGLIKYKKLMKPYNEYSYLKNLCYKEFIQLPRDITNIIAEYANDYDFQAMTYSLYQEYKKDELNNKLNYYRSTDIQINTNLIIVSHSIFHQWKNEILEKTNFTVKYICSKRDLDFTKEDIKNGYFDKYDIVLCTINKIMDIYQSYYLRFCALWTSDNDEYVWSRVFVDEADTITNTCRYFPYIRSHFLWAITASYNSLYYHKKNNFITEIIKKLSQKIGKKKELLNALTITCDEKYIQKDIILPDIKYEFTFFEDNFLYSFFKDLKIDSLNECLNSDNFTGALDIIVCMNDHSRCVNNENLMYFVHKTIPFSLEDNIFYKYNLIVIYLSRLVVDFMKMRNKISRSLRRNKKLRACKEIFEKKILLKKLMRITQKFYYYQSLITYNNLCIMCYEHHLPETMINEDNFICDECKHKTGFIKFNFVEVYTMYKNILQETKTVVCNRRKTEYNHTFAMYLDELEQKTVFTGDERTLQITNFNTENMKIPYIVNNIKKPENKNKRFLIFTNNYYLIENMQTAFGENGIVFTIIKGNNNTINKRIKDYNNGKIQVLLLNAKYFGSGLNLQNTDEIYIFNNLNYEMEKQVIGRANRCGRNTNLIVNYVLYENERERLYSKIQRRNDEMNMMKKNQNE